jgi:neuronal guanine nucleotide exchange factor
MFQQKGSCDATYGGNNSINNGVKRPQIANNNISHTNQVTSKHLHHQSSASSFIKLFNPFSKSKSHNLSGSDKIAKSENCDETSNKTSASVKVLKQFWNEQIKTAKSTENLCNSKSATIKYFSQSNESINEPRVSRGEKSLTLDGGCLRLPLDDFNKYKDANFIRNKKIKLLSDNNNSANVIRHSHRPESFTLNDSLLFPQISSNGGKIHWLKREDILTASAASSSKKSTFETDENNGEVMSVKANKANASRNSEQASSGENNKTAKRATRSDSVASSAGSIHSNTSSLNSTNRKFSFKTNPTTTASYMNKKLSANGGSKVAQLAQRFNQMIQQDATILEEVKKRGTVVVHHSGGRVFKIKEEKVDKKKVANDENATAVVSDDAISLPSIGGKNSTRRKSTLRKRPSIRVTVKDSNSSVLSKRQLYEANIVNKETIVLKPKVPDKSERVLAKTKELKSKKLNEILKTERHRNDDNLNKAASSNKELRSDATESTASTDTSNGSNSSSCVNNGKADAEETSEPIKDISSSTSSKNNLRKIYDKITFRPTFLYGKKANNKMMTTETGIHHQKQQPTINAHENDRFIHEEEVMAAESNKTADNIDSSNEIDEDDLDFKPIDLNLNVYFNNENLSKTRDEADEATGENIGNASSQGSINDVTNGDESDDKPDQPLMKPNESFLFSRTLSATKFDTFSFIRGMLDEDENLLSNENENILPPSNKIDVECNATEHEKSYEIISRHDDNEKRTTSGECVAVDIDKNNNSDDNVEERRNVEVQENIYQSLCEVKGKRDCNDDDAISIKSYESFENYDEIKQNILDNKINLADILKSTAEDDYIFPETLQPPELPAPRKNTVPKISSPILTSTTSNLVQANNLSVPKLQKSNSCTSTTYEKIKYDQLPSKQQHQMNVVELPLPPRNNITTNNGKVTSLSVQQQQHTKYNENIYDTIKSRSTIGEYEKIPDDKNKNNDSSKKDEEEEGEEEISMTDTFDINDGDNPYKNSKNDTMSIISNCYESISLKQSYSTINQILRHAISSTTLTSEHRINSIYGESMTGQSLSLTPPSDRSGGSDNSDEWIDVDSEEEEEEVENNDRFIV